MTLALVALAAVLGLGLVFAVFQVRIVAETSLRAALDAVRTKDANELAHLEHFRKESDVRVKALQDALAQVKSSPLDEIAEGGVVRDVHGNEHRLADLEVL